MFNNGSFLVIEVNPSNNEINVPVTSWITVRFGMDMKEDTIAGNILLSKVNGSSVDVTVSYHNPTRMATITPNSQYTKGADYRLLIQGGASGIQSITEVTMPENLVYQFRTTYDVLLTSPRNLQAVPVDCHYKLTWLEPDQIDPVKDNSYIAAISTSNLSPDTDPGAVVWPKVPDSIGKITGLEVTSATDLTPGNYYAYVRCTDGTSLGPWAQVQFAVLAPVVEVVGVPLLDEPSPYFEVAETYPAANQPNISPDSIKVLFSHNIDDTTITPAHIYIINKKVPEKGITAMGLMTDFAPTKSMAFTIDPIVGTTNFISLTVDPTLFKNEGEYTVIVREQIKSVTGDSLGQPYAWTFTGKYDKLFGDAEWIRLAAKPILGEVDEMKLYRFMAEASGRAWDILAHTRLTSAGTTQTTRASFDSLTDEQVQCLDEYVTYSAAYDLIVDAYMAMTPDFGTTRVLGDLTISGTSTMRDLTSLIGEYKQAVKIWEDQLRGHHNRGYAKPNVVSKGEAIETYPSTFTRDSYKDIGSL